jgi:hypothetical protein
MSMARWIVGFVLLFSGVLFGSALADQTFMQITFDDKAIDQPIGDWGTGVGEPTEIGENIEAIVRAAPFDTPSLEIHNTHATNTGYVIFELPGSPVSSGLVVIVMDLWFYQTGPGWSPYCELYSSSYQTLMSFFLRNDGGLTIFGGGDPVILPVVPTGRSFPVLIALDMDQDTFSVWMDGTEISADSPLMVTGATFEKVYLGAGYNCDPANRFSVDQIRVLDWLPPVATTRTTWGGIRRLYR